MHCNSANHICLVPVVGLLALGALLVYELELLKGSSEALRVITLRQYKDLEPAVNRQPSSGCLLIT